MAKRPTMKLTRFELDVMEIFWLSGRASVRAVYESRDAIETWTLLIRAGKPVELERFKAYKYRGQTPDA